MWNILSTKDKRWVGGKSHQGSDYNTKPPTQQILAKVIFFIGSIFALFMLSF
jgi:hypothetical protein